MTTWIIDWCVRSYKNLDVDSSHIQCSDLKIAVRGVQPDAGGWHVKLEGRVDWCHLGYGNCKRTKRVQLHSAEFLMNSIGVPFDTTASSRCWDWITWRLGIPSSGTPVNTAQVCASSQKSAGYRNEKKYSNCIWSILCHTHSRDWAESLHHSCTRLFPRQLGCKFDCRWLLTLPWLLCPVPIFTSKNRGTATKPKSRHRGNGTIFPFFQSDVDSPLALFKTIGKIIASK